MENIEANVDTGFTKTTYQSQIALNEKALDHESFSYILRD
jgi:hypothetical protein